MKRISFLILALITLSLACRVPVNLNESVRSQTLTNAAEGGHVAEPAPAGTCARVISAGALHVRSAPGTNSPVVMYLEPGQVVAVEDQIDSMWWRVRIVDEIGFVRARYLEIVECE